MEDKITLNEDQNDALDKLMQFIKTDTEHSMALLTGAAGSGKAQPLYSKILTPNGWKCFKDINIGDRVFSKEGRISNIIGVFPQGKKQIYTITFSDNTTVDCCEDHLWEVQDENRKLSITKQYIKTTKEIINHIQFSQLSIPVVKKPFIFENDSSPMIDPYTFGILLGKGLFKNSKCRFSNKEEFIRNKIEKRLENKFKLKQVKYKNINKIRYDIINLDENIDHSYLKYIEENHLNVENKERYIPNEWFFYSVQIRIELLNGLMDSNGYVDKKGNLYFKSKSIRLVESIRQLVYSLGGGTESIRYKTKKSVVMKLLFNDGIDVFTLPRKKEKYKVGNDFNGRVYIKTVEYKTVDECVCIAIDDPSKLYVTDNFKLTHNTTLLQSFIKRVLDETVTPKIVCCSPTWKALKVLKSMCPDDIKDYVHFSTLHSLLGLKHSITNDGKEVYSRDPKVMSKFPFYNIIIVDETSMVADQLFHEIIDQNYNSKVLFVGDMNQINPVNHTHAIPMLEIGRTEHNILHYQLTKIVRQAENNPIIKFSQKVLKDEFEYIPGYKELTENSTGIVMLANNKAGLIAELLKHYFCDDNFDNDANYCKLIAWRNATVESFNKNIRSFKYGLNADKIVKGEKLIADKPIKNLEDSSEILFHTNEDLVVKQCKISKKRVYDFEYKIYELSVDGDENSGNIHVLHEKSQAMYNINLKKFAALAKEETNSYERMKKWKKYFEFVDSFSSIKYNYGITAHCSQGSTYENCFVVYSDIIANRNEQETNRILYTAITRPKNMLYIL